MPRVFRTNCTRCKDPDHGEDCYDGYGIYCGRYCQQCWEKDSRREFGRTRFFDPSFAGESLDEEG